MKTFFRMAEAFILTIVVMGAIAIILRTILDAILK